MKRQLASVIVALFVYIVLVLLLYGLNRAAIPQAGGLFPLWYSCSELLLKAATAIGPGICAGWLCRSRGLAAGAIAGGAGGAIEVIMLSALGNVSFGEYGARILLGAVFTAIASAFTNSAGGYAGEHIRRKPHRPASAGPDSSPVSTGDAPPVAAKRGRRRRRRLRFG